MTIQACCHSKLRNLHCAVHVFNFPMAIRTVDSFVDMHAMIEICIIGNTMNAFPWQRNTLIKIFSKFDDFRFVFLRDGVAIHARCHRRYRCMGRAGDRCMAIFAVDLHGTGMELVRECDWLNRCIPYSITFSPRIVIRSNEK